MMYLEYFAKFCLNVGEHLKARAQSFDFFAEFCRDVNDKLKSGYATHGDVSFKRNPLYLIGELKMEGKDLPGWSLVLWVRFEKMKTIDKSINSILENLQWECIDIAAQGYSIWRQLKRMETVVEKLPCQTIEPSDKDKLIGASDRVIDKPFDEEHDKAFE